MAKIIILVDGISIMSSHGGFMDASDSLPQRQATSSDSIGLVAAWLISSELVGVQNMECQELPVWNIAIDITNIRTSSIFFWDFLASCVWFPGVTPQSCCKLRHGDAQSPFPYLCSCCRSSARADPFGATRDTDRFLTPCSEYRSTKAGQKSQSYMHMHM